MCTTPNGWPGCWRTPDTVRAADGADADVVVFNTCAVRENADNKLYGNLSHLAPRKAAPTPRCRSPSAGVWRRRTATRCCRRRRGWTSSSAPTTSVRCRRCSTVPGTTSAAQVEIARGAAGIPVGAARGARIRLRRLGVDLGRLQQHLHVLHRARAARQRGRPQARRRSGRGAVAGRPGCARGDAARAERQRVRRVVRTTPTIAARPRRVRDAAARLRAPSTVWSASGSPRRIPPSSPTT